MLLYAELLLTGRCKEGRRTGTLFVACHTGKSSSYRAFCCANQWRLSQYRGELQISSPPSETSAVRLDHPALKNVCQ